ncbi:hypothetical protein [Rhizobium sp. ERR 1071]|uniref:hypothetical protein n=1 Tax=Rhizobium sp. ERR 1071 TaxID=2572677 RepID=UPI00119D092D|nr:hypothetical protein [Rhizobium sp. ERR1071]
MESWAADALDTSGMFDAHHLQLASKPSWKDAEDDRGERVRDRAAVRATLALEDEVDTRRLCSII